jgi:hypothetical protein
VQYDAERILQAVATYQTPTYDGDLFRHFSEPAIADRLGSAFRGIDDFFEHSRLEEPDISDPWRLYEAQNWQARLKGKARRILRAKLGARL